VNGTVEVPRELARFIALFDAGRHWDSHEALEGPWRDHRSPFYQALIILASAYVHLERRNPRGVKAQMEKALRYLAPYPERYLGFDVRELVRRADGARRVAAAAEGGWEMRIPVAPLPFDADRIRGDEPELANE
jgi:uncharacterized protein